MDKILIAICTGMLWCIEPFARISYVDRIWHALFHKRHAIETKLGRFGAERRA